MKKSFFAILASMLIFAIAGFGNAFANLPQTNKTTATETTTKSEKVHKMESPSKKLGGTETNSTTTASTEKKVMKKVHKHHKHAAKKKDNK